MEFYDATILAINAISILFFVGLTLMLVFTAKIYKSNFYAILLVAATSIPIYLYNVCYVNNWLDIAAWLAPFAYSCDTMTFPILWLFVYKNYNHNFKFNIVRLLHFFPTIICFAIYSMYMIYLPSNERENFLLNNGTYMSQWIEQINITVIAAQFIIYYIIIYVYLYYAKQFINKNFSEAEWTYDLWIPRFLTLLVLMATILIVGNKMDIEINLWLIPAVHIVSFYYFAYHIVKTPNIVSHPHHEPVPDFQFEIRTKRLYVLDDAQVKKKAALIMEYLKSTEAYLNPILTLRNVADATGIEHTYFPQIFKKHFQCSFFDLINKLRIERAKKLLLESCDEPQDIDRIAAYCGFNSRVTFYNAFKANEGKTLTQWLQSRKKLVIETI